MGQVTITLDDELERLLRQEAAARCQRLEEYLPSRLGAEDALAGVEVAADLHAQTRPAGLSFEELHQRVLNSLKGLFDSDEIQNRVRAVAPYASFEQWSNLEIFYQLHRDLAKSRLPVRPELPYEGVRGRADVAVLAGGLGQDWGAYRIESKQIWNEGSYHKQTRLAQLDAQRVSRFGGGLLVIMVASNQAEAVARKRLAWVERKLDGYVQFPGIALLELTMGSPCVLIWAYRVPPVQPAALAA